MMHTERVGRGCWALWLVLVAFAFWGGEAQGTRGGAGARGRGRAQAAARASQPLPPALRAAYLAARQAEGGSEYAVRRGEGGLLADNPAQGFSIAFSDQGVALAGAGAPRATLRPMRFGCAGEMREVERAQPEVRAERVAFPRQGFVEWYINGPLGLEQGFNVDEPPSCAGMQAQALEVELALSEGLSASLEAGGEQIALRDGAGQRVLGLSELYAIDARGNVLPARLGVTEAHGVSMRVETAGAEYPVVIDPLVWKEEQQLLSSAAKEGAQLGTAVAISGDTAIIGATSYGEVGAEQGSVHVFVRKRAAWTEQAKLVPSDGKPDDAFGWSVAISGDTALIGARGNNELGALAGAAYVFVRQGTSWSQQKKLLPSDGVAGDDIGVSVAIAGDTALVGADFNHEKGQNVGAAYVFVRQGASWSQQQKILASDGVPQDSFGCSVALSGDTAIIGAYLNDPKADDAGAAYVFVRKGASWSQQQKLSVSDAIGRDYFGYSIALSGDTALVGAIGNAEKGNDAGAAYVFVRKGASWSQQQKLLPSDGSADDAFGYSVAIAGDTALVGAIGNDEKGNLAGAAYLFVRQDTAWSEQQKLLASNGAVGDRFGRAVALEANTAIVGAPDSSQQASHGGTAYAFILPLACSKDADCPASPPEDCALAVCNTAEGACGIQQKPDGAVCPTGICTAGVCAPDPTTSMSSTESASSSASAGGAGGGGTGGGAGHSGGCNCATRGAPSHDALDYCAMLLLSLLPLARRRSRRSRRGGVST